MLGPRPSIGLGPGEDMTKQPSLACLTPTTRGELETTAQRVPGRQAGERDQKPRRGFTTIIGTRTDRAVKASPTGGLRPALTALTLGDSRRGQRNASVPRSS
jgi:hypothetical protein